MSADTTPFCIEADGLTVRLLEERDATAVQYHRTHPETVRYGGWRPPTVAEVEKLARDQVGARPGKAAGWCQLAIEAEIDGERRVVGDFGAGGADPGRQVELGIVLDPAAQGRGIATRACTLLIGWLFDAGLHRITARIDPRNTPSVKLFERLGFRREGHEIDCFWDEVYDEWADELLYAVLAREWQ